MKKWVILLLALCLLLGGAIGYLYRGDMTPPLPGSVTETELSAPAPEETPDAQSAPLAEDAPAAEGEAAYTPESLDLERLYATHAPDEIVLTVGGQQESWDTYFYFLAYQARNVEGFFNQMHAYYGMPLHWADVAEGEDKTYAQLAVEGIEGDLKQFAAIEGFAHENGITLSAENLEELEQQLQADITAVCGEGATEADFEEYLAGLHISRGMYERIGRINQLYRQSFVQLYGEEGEKVSDEQAMAYLEDKGYLSANHILFMSIDPETGEALAEEELARKKAEAERLAKLLQEIEDPAELLERFAELKEEYCEDSGKTDFPAGYTFTPGTMVPAFEESCEALQDYEVSAPVESDYGFHVILRLPLDPDAQLLGSDSGAANARAAAANEEYGQRMQAYMDALQLDYAEGFEQPKLLDYVIAQPTE